MLNHQQCQHKIANLLQPLATQPYPRKSPTSSPTDQKEVEDSSSDTNGTVKTIESQTTEASSKNSPESQLKAKGQQVDHSSPSATPLPKTKALAAPQRAGG